MSSKVESGVYVPLVSGDEVRGLIQITDVERTHAFSESDVRLLQTLANSMVVALENARLFDETQRALAVFYRDLAKHMPHDRIVVIDGSGSMEDVHERIHAAYRASCG